MKEPTIKCVIWDLDNTIWDGTLLEDSSVSLKPGIVEVLYQICIVCDGLPGGNNDIHDDS